MTSEVLGKRVVVHTGVGPESALMEESKALDAPDIAFYKRGRCRTPEQVLEAIRDADVALCMGEPYTREVLANAPRLKAVIRYGVGVDTIDLDAATEFGIVVGYFPDFCIPEVADHALMLLLACARKLVRMDRALRTSGWNAARDLRAPMGCLHGEMLGLIAFGNIS
ncbi:MAG: hypothetical protein FJZ90_11385, partial [Chloroflexi bacterium]|nr:hypothetical protein [Chloroflexota bacterium]